MKKLYLLLTSCLTLFCLTLPISTYAQSHYVGCGEILYNQTDGCVIYVSDISQN